MGFFAILSVIIKFIPYVLQLIPAIENLYGAMKGQGPLKKELLMGAASATIDGLQEAKVITIKPEAKAVVLSVAAKVVDTSVATMNAQGVMDKLAAAAGVNPVQYAGGPQEQ